MSIHTYRIDRLASAGAAVRQVDHSHAPARVRPCVKLVTVTRTHALGGLRRERLVLVALAP